MDALDQAVYAVTGPLPLSPTLLVLVALSFSAIAGLIALLRKRTKLSSGDAVLILGLCNAGKSLLFSQLLDGKRRETVSSQKENKRMIEFEGGQRPVLVVDLPGHHRLRTTLFQWLPRARCILFVVDSVNFQLEVTGVAEYLYELLVSPVLNKRLNVPICIVCNKADMDSSTQVGDIKTALEKELNKIRLTKDASVDVAGTEEEGKEYIYLGYPGEDFSFEHLPDGLEVSFGTCSARNGELDDVNSFVIETFNSS